MTAKSSKAEIKRGRQSRTLYLYDRAKEENWESYTQELQKRLESQEVLESIRRMKQCNREEINKINSIWKTIEEAIITAASKHIPKKKVYNISSNRRNSQKEQ